MRSSMLSHRLASLKMVTQVVPPLRNVLTLSEWTMINHEPLGVLKLWTCVNGVCLAFLQTMQHGPAL